MGTERSDCAREQGIALYKSDQQQQQKLFAVVLSRKLEDVDNDVGLYVLRFLADMLVTLEDGACIGGVYIGGVYIDGAYIGGAYICLPCIYSLTG